MSRTVEQRRASYALGFIQNIPETCDKVKLRTHINKLPSLILQCGLGQALAFLLADDEGRQEKPSWILYKCLQTWLCGKSDENDPTHPMRVYTGTSLIDTLVNGSRNDYFSAQEEALLLFNWLKKFADAKLP